jgi:hypothetical protein
MKEASKVSNSLTILSASLSKIFSELSHYVTEALEYYPMLLRYFTSKRVQCALSGSTFPPTVEVDLCEDSGRLA